MIISGCLIFLVFGMALFLPVYIFRLPFVFVLLGILVIAFVQYLVGPLVISLLTRFRYLRDGEHPWLESTLKSLSAKCFLPTPRLAIVPSRTPNAFVFGRRRDSCTLAMSEGLLRNLNQSEITSVIGHELGHIKHWDFVIMTSLSLWPLLAYLFVRWIYESTYWSYQKHHTLEQIEEKWREKERMPDRRHYGGTFLLVLAVVPYLAYIVLLLCISRLSRLREHYADAFSAFLTRSPHDLASALTKINYGLSLAPKLFSDVRMLYICDPFRAGKECQKILKNKDEFDLDRDGVLDLRELQLAMEKEAKSRWLKINRWVTTHPPTFKRLQLLRTIEKEIKSGRFVEERVYDLI